MYKCQTLQVSVIYIYILYIYMTYTNYLNDKSVIKIVHLKLS